MDQFDEEKNAAQAEADAYHATVSLNTEGKRQEEQAQHAAEAKRDDIQVCLYSTPLALYTYFYCLGRY